MAEYEGYERIEREVRRHLDRVVEWRRAIHRRPELSRCEERTAELVAGVLEGLGLEVRRGVGGHGVLGLSLIHI